MIKRILVALALAASLGGGLLACNTPAGTSAPTVAPVPSTPAASDGGTTPSDAAPSVEPSAS